VALPGAQREQARGDRDEVITARCACQQWLPHICARSYPVLGVSLYERAVYFYRLSAGNVR
jgi:hypothetical protein